MNYERLKEFVDGLKCDVYPEPLDNKHFIDSGIESIEEYLIPGQKVLDIGCGHGYALKAFKERKLNPVGITLSTDDKIKSQEHCDDVRIMDMSNMDFADGEFDGIFARHSLEHSIAPYFTLHEIARILKPGGWLYLEVPNHDTDAHHETNGNHYSVLPLSMWGNLMNRVGFSIKRAVYLNFTLQEPFNGRDVYQRIVGVKK